MLADPKKSEVATLKLSSQEERKNIVQEFFELVMQGKPKEGLRFFSPDCRTHNPYVRGSMGALLDSMASVQEEQGPKYRDSDFSIKRILTDGNVVAAHTELLYSKSKPGDGGLRQVHLFRFGRDNKIEEYWDVTQMIEPSLPNAEGAF